MRKTITVYGLVNNHSKKRLMPKKPTMVLYQTSLHYKWWVYCTWFVSLTSKFQFQNKLVFPLLLFIILWGPTYCTTSSATILLLFYSLFCFFLTNTVMLQWSMHIYEGVTITWPFQSLHFNYPLPIFLNTHNMNIPWCIYINPLTLALLELNKKDSKLYK